MKIVLGLEYQHFIIPNRLKNLGIEYDWWLTRQNMKTMAL